MPREARRRGLWENQGGNRGFSPGAWAEGHPGEGSGAGPETRLRGTQVGRSADKNQGFPKLGATRGKASRRHSDRSEGGSEGRTL